jgi:O-antigen ligase
MIQKKLEKTVEKKNLKIPFQRKLYFSFLFVSILFLGIGFALINIFPPFALTGVVVILAVYIIPTLIGFDILSSYQEEFDIPKLVHPKRWTILCLNLICGWTIILWVVALYIACCPGKVSATTVKYNEVT